MNEITISTEEYKELLRKSVRLDAFAEYVNHEAFAIDRKTCGMFLGFEVQDARED